MAGISIKSRPVGAIASLGRTGYPRVTSRTDGHIDVVTSASSPGFNPLDLLFSSLAACLALSARIAASRLGLIERFSEISVDVTGEKPEAEPYRITRFVVVLTIRGTLSAEQGDEMVHLAEEMCTVSNTLKGAAQIDISICLLA